MRTSTAINRAWAGDTFHNSQKTDEGQTRHTLSVEGVTRTFPLDVELVLQGKLSRDVLLLHQGIAKLQHMDQSGRETILGLRSDGAILGIASALTGRTNVASVVTVTSCSVESISVQQFRIRVNQDPSFSTAVHEQQAYDELDCMDHLADLTCHSSRVRLIRVLKRMLPSASQADGRGIKLTIPLKRRELACFIGVTPEHLSRLLRMLQEEELISVQKGWILIKSVEQLDRAESHW